MPRTQARASLLRRAWERYHDLFSIVPGARCAREMCGLGLPRPARRRTVASARCIGLMDGIGIHMAQ